jgi:phosphopantothenate synthetase
MYITINNRQLQFTNILHADVLFVALETADKTDVKTSLATMKDGGNGVITVPQVILSTGRGKCRI